MVELFLDNFSDVEHVFVVLFIIRNDVRNEILNSSSSMVNLSIPVS